MKPQIESRPSIKDWTHDEFVLHLMEHVFDSEEQASALYYTLCTEGANLLLYGPPGYAKSMILEIGISMVVPDFYAATHMQTAAPGMPMEPFLGTFDAKRYKEEGVAHYNLDKTVFLCGNPYGVLEEGLSAPPKVLLALRDAFQRRFLCVDGACYELKLKNYFIPTNVYPEKWIKSLPEQEKLGGQALLDRFHRHVEVVWKDHSAAQWQKFFTHQFGQDSLLSEMMGEACAAGHQLNPRLGAQLFPVYETYGLQAVRNYNRITPAVFEIFEKVEKRAPYISAVKKFESELDTVDEALQGLATKALVLTKNEVKNLMAVVSTIGVEAKALKIPSDAAYTERLSKVINRLSPIQSKLITELAVAPERKAGI